jgi:hypothetical protein
MGRRTVEGASDGTPKPIVKTPNPASPRAYRIWQARAYRRLSEAVKDSATELSAKSIFFL